MLNIRTARAFFLRCTIINYLLLILWFVLLMLPHEGLYRVATGWWVGGHASILVNLDQFDYINLLGLVLFKAAVILFNLVPCIALYLVKDRTVES